MVIVLYFAWANQERAFFNQQTISKVVILPLNKFGRVKI